MNISVFSSGKRSDEEGLIADFGRMNIRGPLNENQKKEQETLDTRINELAGQIDKGMVVPDEKGLLEDLRVLLLQAREAGLAESHKQQLTSIQQLCDRIIGDSWATSTTIATQPADIKQIIMDCFVRTGSDTDLLAVMHALPKPREAYLKQVLVKNATLLMGAMIRKGGSESGAFVAFAEWLYSIDPEMARQKISAINPKDFGGRIASIAALRFYAYYIGSKPLLSADDNILVHWKMIQEELKTTDYSSLNRKFMLAAIPILCSAPLFIHELPYGVYMPGIVGEQAAVVMTISLLIGGIAMLPLASPLAQWCQKFKQIESPQRLAFSALFKNDHTAFPKIAMGNFDSIAAISNDPFLRSMNQVATKKKSPFTWNNEGWHELMEPYQRNLLVEDYRFVDALFTFALDCSKSCNDAEPLCIFRALIQRFDPDSSTSIEAFRTALANNPPWEVRALALVMAIRRRDMEAENAIAELHAVNPLGIATLLLATKMAALSHNAASLKFWKAEMDKTSFLSLSMYSLFSLWLKGEPTQAGFADLEDIFTPEFLATLDPMRLQVYFAGIPLENMHSVMCAIAKNDPQNARKIIAIFPAKLRSDILAKLVLEPKLAIAEFFFDNGISFDPRDIAFFAPQMDIQLFTQLLRKNPRGNWFEALQMYIKSLATSVNGNNQTWKLMALLKEVESRDGASEDRFNELVYGMLDVMHDEILAKDSKLANYLVSKSFDEFSLPSGNLVKEFVSLKGIKFKAA